MTHDHIWTVWQDDEEFAANWITLFWKWLWPTGTGYMLGKTSFHFHVTCQTVLQLAPQSPTVQYCAFAFSFHELCIVVTVQCVSSVCSVSIHVHRMLISSQNARILYLNYCYSSSHWWLNSSSCWFCPRYVSILHYSVIFAPRRTQQKWYL